MSDGKRIIIKWWALPGSVVDLRVVKQKKDYIEAHITHIHSQDPQYMDGEIFCPHFFSTLGNDNLALNTQHSKPQRKVGCGWCKRQSLSYPTQLKLKEDIIHDSFTKIKKLIPDIEILPIIGSPLEKWYRNKIEFSFGKYITKNSSWINETLSDWSLGFHKQGEFSKVVDIDRCGLISDKANELYQYIKKLCLESGLPVYDQVTHQGFFRHLVIRQGCNTDQFLVNLAVANDNLKDKKNMKRDDLLDLFQKDEFLKKNITSCVITYNNGLADIIRSQDCETKTLRWDGYMYEKLIFDATEVVFRISPFSFFQTNTVWAQQLFSKAMEMVGMIEWTILDLYCGTWSIGLTFLKSGKWNKIIWIEIVEDAIQDALHNAKINWLENDVLFFANPAEKAFTAHPTIKDRAKEFWLIIVDPPRDGLHKNVIATIADLKKQSDFKVLYISCNPITMARDIEEFLKLWFHLKQLQPVDMFPQTHHIEVIWVLT